MQSERGNLSFDGNNLEISLVDTDPCRILMSTRGLLIDMHSQAWVDHSLIKILLDGFRETPCTGVLRIWMAHSVHGKQLDYLN